MVFLIDDLVEGIYRLLLSDYAQPVNIGNPDEITIKEFAEEILKLTGANQKIIFQPLPTDDPKQRQPDISKAREILGWEPTVSRAEGLKITYEYFKSLPNKELKHKEFDEYNKKLDEEVGLRTGEAALKETGVQALGYGIMRYFTSTVDKKEKNFPTRILL